LKLLTSVPILTSN